MFALICTLFMRKFRCQIIIVGPMTCTSVLCVCCACVWMLFFWFVYADRQSYNVNNIYCGVQSHRMLLVNTRIHIGLVQWNDDIYFHSQWAYMKQCNQMRMMFYVADLLYYLYTAVFLLVLLFHCFMQRDCAFLSRNSIADMDFINIVSAWELREYNKKLTAKKNFMNNKKQGLSGYNDVRIMRITGQPYDLLSLTNICWTLILCDEICLLIP